ACSREVQVAPCAPQSADQAFATTVALRSSALHLPTHTTGGIRGHSSTPLKFAETNTPPAALLRRRFRSRAPRCRGAPRSHAERRRIRTSPARLAPRLPPPDAAPCPAT